MANGQLVTGALPSRLPSELPISHAGYLVKLTWGVSYRQLPSSPPLSYQTNTMLHLGELLPDVHQARTKLIPGLLLASQISGGTH